MGRAVPADDLPSFDRSAALAATDKELNLPAGLSAAQINVESGGNPRAVSKAGAMGLAQVMPKTLDVISKRLGRKLDPYNEEDAVTIHREVMRENLGKFKDPAKALMAYNGGWDESKWTNPETAAYVGKVNGERKKQSPIVAAADKVLSAVSGTAQAASRAVPVDDLPDMPSAAAAKPADKSILSGMVDSSVQAMKDTAQMQGNLLAGAVRGAGSIGATLLWPIDKATDMYMGDRGPNLSGLITGKQPISRNEQRREAMDAQLKDFGADTDSLAYKGGKLGAEIAGTAGVGGTLAKGIQAVAPLAARAGISAPTISALANSARSGGFTTGLPQASIATAAGAGNMIARIAGGVATSGASAAAIDPTSAVTGAIIGGVMPPALAGAGKVASYAGQGIKALVQPFTTKGQEAIAGKIINRFAEGGPTTMNTTELVKGSAPTLAEATGNANVARMQSTLRDVRPNAFVERETANAAARNAAFDEVAGDAGKLDFFKASRAEAAQDLYGEALKQSNTVAPTPYVKGRIKQLLDRPSMEELRPMAQKLARERGDKPAAEGSLAALHDIKTALDDKISEAVRKGKGGEAKALGGTKDKLLDVMEKLSPQYKEARITYAEMSKPVNQMEVLQGLKLTDAKGNITLSKVQNALDSIERKRSGPGIDAAKSLIDDQMNTLKAIRDDLLRQTNSNAGKSAGSTTFQNIATDNILSTLAPGKLGGVLTGKVGGALGQLGKLAYSGPNEAIRNRLVDMMLDPALAQRAMNTTSPQLSGVPRTLIDLANSSAPSLYRAAPALSTNR